MVYDTELNVSMSRVEVTKQLVAQERHRMGVKLICSKIRAVLIEAAVPYYLWKESLCTQKIGDDISVRREASICG